MIRGTRTRRDVRMYLFWYGRLNPEGVLHVERIALAALRSFKGKRKPFCTVGDVYTVIPAPVEDADLLARQLRDIALEHAITPHPAGGEP
jgi:hypothetical protein